MNMNTYKDFIVNKSQSKIGSGFDPHWLPDFLFEFQRELVSWAMRRGKAAIFADCGLGKTPMQLVWAENVCRETNKPVLIVTPLAFSFQTVKEAEKFGIDCQQSREGEVKPRITVTNYERLHYFKPSDFSGMVCDESSILKNFSGKIKQSITEFMRLIPYRLLCTATAAPNDFYELGTSSEALGELGYTDMITQFFKEQVSKDYLGWGRKTYDFRGHAEQPFWKWVCSWSRACRKPSDLGFADDGFILPKLIESERIVKNSTPRSDMLFAIPANDIREQREERRITIDERCSLAAEITEKHDGSSVVWCHLNDEGDKLTEQCKDAEQVSGSMTDESKESKLSAFQRGEIKTLIVKPRIACYGLNWQHCHNVVTFPSHSYEQYYQAVRRCWRFGQKKSVKVSIVSTEGEARVLSNLQRKSVQADKMFSSLVTHMNDSMAREVDFKFTGKERLPSWLSLTRK